VSSPSIEATSIPLSSNSVFLLDFDGHKVVALKLSSKVANEISGQKRQSGLVARLKEKLGLVAETERWLTVTNVDNPLLEQYEKFGALVSQQLAAVTGTAVSSTDLAISASVPVDGVESPDSSEVGASGSSFSGNGGKSDISGHPDLS
jgi:hypothetical protein